MSTLKEYVKGRLSGRAKNRFYEMALTVRQKTWQFRSLPDFIIIGAQKAGTTSLYYYLSQHPQILPSLRKEVHFFDGGVEGADHFEKGQAWYRANFPLKMGKGDHKKTFEVSPLYIFNPLVPKRLFDLVPEVKILAVLRNPSERAISHYLHEKRDGREPLPIMEALQAEDLRLKPVIDAMDYRSDAFIHCSYKTRGLYREQIDRYLQYFPNNRFLILSSDRLFSDPGGSLRDIFDFVGVDPDFKVKDLKPRNVSSNKMEVEPEVYEYLNNYFRIPNEGLYELVGENYGW